MARALILALILAGCGTTKTVKPDPTVIEKVPVEHVIPKEQKEACDGAVKKSDVPNPKTATQKTWEGYSTKLKDGYFLCRAIVVAH